MVTDTALESTVKLVVLVVVLLVFKLVVVLLVILQVRTHHKEMLVVRAVKD